MIQKLCRKCGELFTPVPSQVKTNYYICRPCLRRIKKAWVTKNPHLVKMEKRRWKERRKTKGTFNRGDRTAQSKRYQKKNMRKVLAHLTIYEALKTGKIIKPKKCSLCSSKEWIMAHHKDYNKRLDVVWVCWKCHNKIHKKD